ncbi:NADP-dependent oxidoreductase [Rhodococcus sp. IEGM 1379]|uniref:NADP-dependent oxidoreductase n=1 Tax=Rhodococcus sp. IEGM 1379 TaxID=3047086 RepID=UPI0024B80E77|nr:NADP-dependent oxidoreductase [Rhodococcus sp. IEGM 1379]MDI9914192.1 NADP-dependent oxidoreductase [Rhodococcus sp. IEGM 1379]
MTDVSPNTNRKLLLDRRPVGFAKESDWKLVSEPVPVPDEGRFVVRVRQISLDPAMRGWMNSGRSYIPPVAIGEVMRAFALGEVVDSKATDFPVGTLVTGAFGVQEYAVSSGDGVSVINQNLDVPASAYLGVLGITGATAYFGLTDVGEFQPGQTVFVSGAAGAVGSTVGQIVKILGGKVIGTAGGRAKCDFLVNELGFDGAIDYKSENVGEELRRLAPGGVNVFFDNVGGEILDAGLSNLAMRARVVVCGAISQYNSTEVTAGPTNYRALLVKRARMEGMVVFDYEDRMAEAVTPLAQWMSEGKLNNIEDIVTGSILEFPQTLMRLFEGQNVGKQILDLGA